MRRLPAILTALALGSSLLQPIPAWSEADALQLGLLEQYRLPLRWDNVEGEPLWLKGQPPQHSYAQGIHLILLDPGQSTSLRLPRGEYLRLHDPEKPLAENALDISLSDGSGLQRHVPGRPDQSGHSRLLSPSIDRERLVHIARPTHHDSGIAVAVFVSEQQVLATIAPYRKQIDFGSDKRELRLEGKATGDDFWPLHPGQPLSATVTGPARLQLESRLRYRAQQRSADQAYQIHALLDGEPLPQLRFDARYDSAQAIEVDGCQQPLAALEKTYLDIPAGEHRLSLDSSTSLYLRLLQLTLPDYLLTEANQPARAAAQIYRELLVSGLPDDAWQIDPQILQQALEFEPTQTLLQQRTAQRLLIDNRHREGGLSAAMLLRRVAQLRPDAPELAKQAQRTLGQASYFRDLLPDNAAAGHSYWYLRRELSPWQKQAKDLHLYTAHLEQGLKTLGRGVFLPLAATALDYALPQRSAPSQLRVALTQSGIDKAVELYLQYDAQTPIRLTLLPAPELDSDAYRPNTAEAALAHLSAEGQGLAQSTLSARFSLQADTAALARAASAELTLPAKVRRIRVWRAESAGAPLQVALQMRTSRPFSLAENDYLSLQQRLGRAHLLGLFEQLLADSPASDDAETRTLASHWQPLLRLLQGRHRAYSAQVKAAQQRSDKRLTPTEQNRLTQAARDAETQARPIEALAHWTRLAAGSAGEIRRRALLARVEILFAQGEEFLAERQLRGITLFDQDAELRNTAGARLLSYYQTSGQSENRLSLLASLALRQPGPPSLQALLAPLFDKGMTDMALAIALLLPDSPMVVEHRLRAAYQLGWWQLFERDLALLPEGEQRQRWLGYRSQRQGDAGQAMAYWQQAGAQGQTLHAAMHNGQAIARALASREPAKQGQALVQWQQWQANHPGPHHWQNAAGLVTDGAGNTTLLAVERDALLDSFRANRAQPLRLRVQGPLQLRLEARLLHPAGDTEARQGWLQLTDGEQRRVLAITNSTPVQGLVLADSSSAVPGTLTGMAYWVGPGEHELTLHAGEQDALFRVMAWRPALPLSALPPLSRDTLAGFAAERTPAKPDTARSCYQHACIQLLDSCATPLSQLPRIEWSELPTKATPAMPSDTATAAITAGRRDGVLLPEAELSLSDYLAGIGVALEQDKRLRPLTADQGLALPVMYGLLWRAEQQPAERPRLNTLGEDWFHRHKHTAGLGGLRRRLLAEASWEVENTLLSSAGIHMLQLPGWQPESPEARTRQVLLGLDRRGQQVLSGFERLGLGLVADRPGRFQLQLELVDIPYLTPQPMSVSYRVDDGPSRSLRLNRDRDSQRLTIDYEAGEHQVELRLRAPTIGQFLVVRVVGGKLPGDALEQTVERSYHVSTRDEPVRLRVEGPTRLRIDERRGALTLPSYRQVGPGWHELTLAPPAGRNEALLRIHRLKPEGVGAKATARQVSLQLQAPAPALLVLPDDESHAVLRLHDAHPLGGQEDGTWSLAAQFERSKPLGVDSSGSDLIDQYLELSAGHRWFAESWNSWFETQALYRLHQRGNPTIGLKEKIYYEPEWAPIGLSLSWEGYTQSTGGPAWSSTWRAGIEQLRWFNEKTYHNPSIELFHRTLTQGSNFDYEPGEVDPDVLSEYSYLHPQGITLSDTVTHNPWLDTQWWASLAVTSDEDWDLSQPEQMNISLGWRQMMGDVQLDLDYSMTHYFAEGAHVWRRPESSRSQDLAARLLWDMHGVRGGRLQWNANFGIGLDDNDYYANFGVTWFFDRGRGYRDFRPRSISFGELRERRLQQGDLNRIEHNLENDE